MTDRPRIARPRSAATLRWLRRSPLVPAGGLVILLYRLAAITAPVLAPHSPLAQLLERRLGPPQPGYPLGLDQLGRDILSRVLFGARLSLLIGLVVVTVAGLLGTTVGVVAGFAGGRIDNVLMRITDVFFAFPSLILAMAIAAALGPSLINTMVAIAVVASPLYARLSRAQTLVLRRQEFIGAACPPGPPGGRRPALDRLRGAATRAGVARADQRATRLHHDAVVGAHVPGPGHSPGGHRVQSGGRRPARPAGSAPAARRLTSGGGFFSSLSGLWGGKGGLGGG